MIDINDTNVPYDFTFEKVDISPGYANRTALEYLCDVLRIPVQIKTLHTDWALLTYDIPNTEEGNRVRSKFLRKSKMMGAVQHNESVYMMPHTDLTNALVMEMASIDDSRIVVFYTTVGESHAVTLSDKYYTTLQKYMRELEKRVNKMEKYMNEDKMGLVEKMTQKTWEYINGLTISVAAYGDEVLANQILGYVARVRSCIDRGAVI